MFSVTNSCGTPMCSTIGDTGHMLLQITPTTGACGFYSHKYNEPVLADDYPMHVGYFYVMDGKVGMCMQSMSVARYKLHEGVNVIRRCDLDGRGQDLLRYQVQQEQAASDNIIVTFTGKPKKSKKAFQK